MVENHTHRGKHKKHGDTETHVHCTDTKALAQAQTTSRQQSRTGRHETTKTQHQQREVLVPSVEDCVGTSPTAAVKHTSDNTKVTTRIWCPCTTKHITYQQHHTGFKGGGH